MRRRSLLAGAAALYGGHALGQPRRDAATTALRWHTAEAGRTDPFVSWTIEIMRARFGVTVCRVPEPDAADLLTVGETALPLLAPRVAWRHGRLCILCDPDADVPPGDAAGLLGWAVRHPGRLAAPPWPAPASDGLRGQMAGWWGMLQPLLWQPSALGCGPTMARLRAGEFDAMVTVETGPGDAGLHRVGFGGGEWLVPFYAMPAAWCRDVAGARALARFLVSPAAQGHASRLGAGGRVGVIVS